MTDPVELGMVRAVIVEAQGVVDEFRALNRVEQVATDPDAREFVTRLLDDVENVWRVFRDAVRDGDVASLHLAARSLSSESVPLADAPESLRAEAEQARLRCRELARAWMALFDERLMDDDGYLPGVEERMRVLLPGLAAEFQW